MISASLTFCLSKIFLMYSSSLRIVHHYFCIMLLYVLVCQINIKNIRHYRLTNYISTIPCALVARTIAFCPPAIFDRKFRGVIRFPPSVRPCVCASVCPCVRNELRCPEPIGRITLILGMKLTYNGTTKTHI